MITTFVIASLAVLCASLAIGVITRRHAAHGGTSVGYLFGGNSVSLATSSNVGAILSYTTVFGALVPGVLGWSLLVPIVTLVSIPAGYWLFGATTRRIRGRFSIHEATTLPDLLEGEAESADLRWAIIAYHAIVLVLELAIARWFLVELLAVDGMVASLVVGYMAVLCGSYVSIGGFGGVLRTDFWQIGLVAVAVGWGGVVLLTGDISLAFDPPAGPSRVGLDLLGSVATGVIVAGFHFATPDLWIRNGSTLGQGASPETRPLFFGAAGLAVAVTGPILLGFHLIARGEALSRDFQILHSLKGVARLIEEAAIAPSGHVHVWLFVAAAVSVFVTSVDTHLVSVMQHFEGGSRQVTFASLRVLPVFSAASLLVVSLSVKEGGFMLLGFLATIILFSTSAVLLRSAWSQSGTVGFRRPLLTYWVVGVVGSTLIWFQPFGNVTWRTVLIILFQAIAAVAVFGLVYAALRTPGGFDGQTEEA